MRNPRLKVDIFLNGQVKGLVPSYTTFDKIEGEVHIQADRDTEFDHIQISFEGTSKTTIPRQSPVAHLANNLNAFHPFLKLRQPIDPNTYAEPRELKPLETYIFPFTFVVPEHLLLHACNHYTSNPHLKVAHTQLPPTLGDAMLSDDGKTMINDMAPMMSEIAYKLKVSVMKKTPPTSPKEFVALSSVAKKVRIIPATTEQPPLEIGCNNAEGYRIRREKYVRKALLGGKTGRLVVTAAQPKPLELPAPSNTVNGCKAAVNSHVKLHVRFDPETEDEEPPRLRSTFSKLKVSTFYSAQAWTDFPSLEIAQAPAHTSNGVYCETINLSSLCVGAAQWKKHDGTDSSRDGSRRSSLISDSSSSLADSLSHHPSASSSYFGKTFYTASILVPVTLPANRTFVPTFHSCLVSRVYTLDLSLSYQPPHVKLPIAPSISLNIPIQITSAPGKGIALLADDLMMLPETQIEDEYYRPRNVSPPSEEDYLDRYSPYSSLMSTNESFQDDVEPNTGNGGGHAPPEYSTITQTGSGVRTSSLQSPAWMLGSLR
ncbi:arrestin (or S-antigen) domain protein [Talaromyces stipitatus ATCC 10500]|uniref:Arrestin (Or S-antigen) domain protein n=1 Tax=Talaromyces stipitatus (strain ATCC 10500 / CBS 375.48 / QM 6759 / NRRL 1006) TaxID=441959 RepID=B8LZ64_TALSN|nr:arrestin (or S-antigen) domain protein [Talaromyces stipitatus ATCC 10500]EED21108.1 arrestin (or S-antigen) domain protein [Talaromyces stipitatus ATCC 10500]